MDSRRKSQQEEKWHLEQFSENCSDFPEGKQVFCYNKQMPDLVVQTIEGNVGIEHTRLTEQLTRNQESLQNKIVTRARELYERENADLLQVNFIFDIHKPLRDKMVEPIALQIAYATKVFVFYLKATKQFQTFGYFESYQLRWHGITNFPMEVTNVSLSFAKSLEGVLWEVDRGSTVPRLIADYLQDRINKKAERINKYVGSYKEMWLLLVAQLSEPSSSFDLEFSTEALQYPYKSPYARIYLMESFLGTLVRLKAAPIQLPPEGEELLGSS